MSPAYFEVPCRKRQGMFCRGAVLRIERTHKFETMIPKIGIGVKGVKILIALSMKHLDSLAVFI